MNPGPVAATHGDASPGRPAVGPRGRRATGWRALACFFRPALALALTAGPPLAPEAAAAPQLTYTAFEAEAASEYRVGWGDLGPSYLRLIGRAELALTDRLDATAVVSPCAGPYADEPGGVTECNTERLVEELTLSGSIAPPAARAPGASAAPTFDFSIGRQIVSIGNTEGFVLLDRMNGRDLCRFARLDIDNKLPNWLAQGRALFGGGRGSGSLSLIVAPFSGKSEVPDPDGYCADEFNAPGQFEGLRDPGNDSLSDWAGALEFGFNRDDWGATLNAVSTNEDIFVIATAPLLAKTRPRTNWFGGTFAATVGGMVLRGELAYAPDRRFTVVPTATVARLAAGQATDGTDERWNLRGVLGLELRKGDWYWALQYFDERVGGGAPLVNATAGQFASLRLRHTLANERIAVDAFAVVDFSTRDAALRAAFAYELGTATRLEVGGTLYTDLGDRVGFFGSYEGRESVFVKLARSF